MPFWEKTLRTSVTYYPNGLTGRAFGTNPRLVRSGIVTEDLLEMTPVVFRDELLLLASAKEGTGAYHDWDFSLCIEKVATHDIIAAWADGYSLASAFIHDDTFYVFAIPSHAAGAQRMDCFWSSDLKDWQSKTILEALPRELLFNNSVCRADGRFVMAFESRAAKGEPFTALFAESTDLMTWTRLGSAARYVCGANPTLRYVEGTFYMLYSKQVTPRWWFETYLTRSRDLIHWEDSPIPPVLAPEGAEDVNTSDPDLVEFRPSPDSPATAVRVYYGYGNQKGKGAITWADFDGTLPEFFKHYYDD